MPRKKLNRRPLKRVFLREWRKHRNLSQEALAGRLDINSGTLSRIERGEVPYNQRFLEAVADALGCEPADLIMRDPTDPAAIWSVWDNLSPPERKQALAVIRALKGTGTDDR